MSGMRALALAMFLFFSMPVFADPIGCQRFPAALAACQPMACREYNPLKLSQHIYREVKGIGADGSCQYEESYLDIQARQVAVSMQCDYTPQQRLEKALGYQELQKGYFVGKKLLKSYFIDDAQEACQPNTGFSEIKEIISRYYAQWRNS